MIKTYVISLADETKRRQHVLAECARYHIDAELVDAVDMRQVTQAEIERLSYRLTHLKSKRQRWLKTGELGCALSHHAVYQKMIEEKHDYALVLEDDVQWIADPSPLLDSQVLNSIAQQYSFDILIMGYVRTLPSQLAYYYRRVPLKNRAIYHINDKVWYFGTPWEQYACGTVAYIISQSGAQKMLQITAKPHTSADDWLYFERQCGVRVLHSRPIFALEELTQFESTISQEKPNFLKTKPSSKIMRISKGYLKYIAMNYLGFK